MVVLQRGTTNPEWTGNHVSAGIIVNHSGATLGAVKRVFRDTVDLGEGAFCRSHILPRFAIDWVKIGPNDDTHHDETTKNENRWGWGEPVLAVADGKITEVVDEFPDNTPRVLPLVTLGNIAGNHIIVQIAQNRFLTYAHLQRGSIKVTTGSHVHRGDVLALLGNSGNTSGAHLHLQVTDRNSVVQSEGVPFLFADFTYLGPDSDYPEKKQSVEWAQLNSPRKPGREIRKWQRCSLFVILIGHDVHSLASSRNHGACITFTGMVALQRISAYLSHARKHECCQGYLHISHGDIKEHSC